MHWCSGSQLQAVGELKGMGTVAIVVIPDMFSCCKPLCAALHTLGIACGQAIMKYVVSELACFLLLVPCHVLGNSPCRSL